MYDLNPKTRNRKIPIIIDFILLFLKIFLLAIKIQVNKTKSVRNVIALVAAASPKNKPART